jgi:nicotinate-nucleotide adenylyltransferase
VKLGLFGGSFDPPHRGHVEPVAAARLRLGLDRVLYLPTGRPPHKPERRLAPAHARYTMVELALLAEEGLFVSPLELDSAKPSYTADTLAEVASLHPEAELHLLLGADSLAQLHTWRRWREIPRRARLVVLARPGWDEERMRREAPAAVMDLLAAGRAVLQPGPAVDLSSSRLRELLCRGEQPPPGALAPLVLDYMRKYALYR